MSLPIQAFHIAPTHHHARLYFAAQDVSGQFGVLTEGDKLFNGHLHLIAERLFSAGTVAATLGNGCFLQVAQPTEQADLHFRGKTALRFRKNQLGFHLLTKGAAHQRVNLRACRFWIGILRCQQHRCLNLLEDLFSKDRSAVDLSNQTLHQPPLSNPQRALIALIDEQAVVFCGSGIGCGDYFFFANHLGAVRQRDGVLNFGHARWLHLRHGCRHYLW